jgi:hypothetical protein
MTPLFISILAGVGLGLFTWYGWGAVENLLEMRSRRGARARADEDSDAG